MFKNKYVGEYDRQDLYDDLRRRTLGKGEKVETFLLNFKYIVSRFKVPPSEDELIWRIVICCPNTAVRCRIR